MVLRPGLAMSFRRVLYTGPQAGRATQQFPVGTEPGLSKKASFQMTTGPVNQEACPVPATETSAPSLI